MAYSGAELVYHYVNDRFKRVGVDIGEWVNEIKSGVLLSIFLYHIRLGYVIFVLYAKLDVIIRELKMCFDFLKLDLVIGTYFWHVRIKN